MTDRDRIELPPWGRDERDAPVETLETVVRRIITAIRARLARG